MKNVYEKEGNVFAGRLQDKYPHLYEQGIWIFGDWDKALIAAGFDPEKMRERGVWDEEKIIDTIRSMHEKHLPLYAAHVMDTMASYSQRHCANSVLGPRPWLPQA